LLSAWELANVATDMPVRKTARFYGIGDAFGPRPVLDDLSGKGSTMTEMLADQGPQENNNDSN